MRRLALSLAIAAGLGAATARADVPALRGFVRAAFYEIDAPRGYLAGGYGPFEDGGEEIEDAQGEARLALDWEPALGWRVLVHGAARTDPDDSLADAPSGLVEAFVEATRGFGAGHEIGARAGQFFLPTSRENVAALWTSPYTLTPSAINAWIGEEFRPIGLDLSWRRTFESEHRLGLAATAFGGNDTAGVLLAWRGFACHDRLTPTGEWVPLPDHWALWETFPRQSPRGTRPFGDDLDGRPGYAARARWSAPADRALLQAAWVDNRGDGELHGDEYAWATAWTQVGAELQPADGLVVAAEALRGTTAMGAARVPGRSRWAVEARFEAIYVLASWRLGPITATARWDDFRVEDLDATPLDDNREDGSAWTLALLGDVGAHWRMGVEWLEADIRRPIAAALPAGGPGGEQVGGDTLRGEIRFTF